MVTLFLFLLLVLMVIWYIIGERKKPDSIPSYKALTLNQKLFYTLGCYIILILLFVLAKYDVLDEYNLIIPVQIDSFSTIFYKVIEGNGLPGGGHFMMAMLFVIMAVYCILTFFTICILGATNKPRSRFLVVASISFSGTATLLYILIPLLQDEYSFYNCGYEFVYGESFYMNSLYLLLTTVFYIYITHKFFWPKKKAA